MALTIAYVSTPNSEHHEAQFAGLRAVVLDLTFDSSYPTTGEDLTAADLGWTYLFGAITLVHPKNAAGTLGLPCMVSANSTNTTLAFQTLESAGDGDPMDESANATDLSLFTGRFVVLGY